MSGRKRKRLGKSEGKVGNIFERKIYIKKVKTLFIDIHSVNRVFTFKKIV